MKVTMLGTGHAMVTNIYNTCYVFTDDELPEDEKYFLVDTGGGSQILSQLKKTGIPWMNIHEIFMTHKHIDHTLGLVWLVRMVSVGMMMGHYNGELHIYGHRELMKDLPVVCASLLDEGQKKFIGNRIRFIPVEDGEKRIIHGKEFTFFDIGSTKAKQFGYLMVLPNGTRVCCCGDEPYNEEYERKFAQGCDWLFHESFCMHRDCDLYHPYQKHHSTAKDAAENAERLGVKNLLLYHTEDSDIEHRKENYTKEAAEYFHGNVFVPTDLETIEL